MDNPDCASIDKTPFDAKEVRLAWPGGNVLVQAEVASTQTQRAQGMMCRESAPDGAGMLFLFQQPSHGQFWMYNTYTPLDILFIDQDGRVIWSSPMAPCTRQTQETDNDWTVRCITDAVRPPDESQKYTAALELPAGWLQRLGLNVQQTDEVTVSWD